MYMMETQIFVRALDPLLTPNLLAHCFLKDLPQFTVLQPVYGKGTGHC